MSRLDGIKARISAADALIPEGIGRDNTYHTYLNGPTYRDLLDHAEDDLRWTVNELERRTRFFERNLAALITAWRTNSAGMDAMAICSALECILAGDEDGLLFYHYRRQESDQPCMPECPACTTPSPREANS